MPTGDSCGARSSRGLRGPSHRQLSPARASGREQGVGLRASRPRLTERTPHELGLLHRPRLPSAAGLDGGVRPSRDLAVGGDLARPRPGRAVGGDRAAAGAGQAARAVGHAPATGARRAGHGPGAPGPDARDPRQLADRAAGIRQRRAGLRQLGDPRDGRHRRAEGALAAPAARRRPAQRVQHDRARHARLGPHAAAHARDARRRRVGDRRAQVVLLQRLDRRLPDRHGRHRPRRARLAARVDVHRAARHARRGDRARRAHDGASVGAVRRLRRALGDPLRERPRGRRRAARRRRRRVHARPGSASGRGASITACAGSASRGAPST